MAVGLQLRRCCRCCHYCCCPGVVPSRSSLLKCLPAAPVLLSTRAGEQRPSSRKGGMAAGPHQSIKTRRIHGIAPGSVGTHPAVVPGPLLQHPPGRRLAAPGAAAAPEVPASGLLWHERSAHGTVGAGFPVQPGLFRQSAAEEGLAALAASAAAHKLNLWCRGLAEVVQELPSLVALPALLLNNPTVRSSWLHQA